MPKLRIEVFKGVLLSALLLASLLTVFSLYAPNSKIAAVPEVPEVLRASGTFTLTTYPIADAYVEEGHPTTNYGTQTKIIARSCDTGTGSNGQMRGFLKFDISSIPAGAMITEAKLRLHGYYITEYIKNVSDVQIRQVTDDSWVETSINWNNQPAYGSVLSNIILLDNDSWAGSHPIDNWYENDVTSFVKSQFDNGDTTISLMIRCMQEYYDNLYYRGSYYNSKEAALENRPTLIVTYEQPLEHGVSVNVAPGYKENLQGSVSSFVVTVTNTGSHQENYSMTIGDNENWDLTLSGDNLTADNDLENVPQGFNRNLILTVAIPDNATIGSLDNIWIRATSVDNDNLTDNDSIIVYCIPAQAVIGLASVELAISQIPPFLWGICKAEVTANLVVNQGDNLRLIFLALDNITIESEAVVWSRTAPGAQTVNFTNLIVLHDDNFPYPSGNVHRIKLVLTDNSGHVILDNMTWFKVVQDDLGKRILWTVLNWASHNNLQQDQLGNEIIQIVLNWGNFPINRDQCDFSL